MQYTLKHPLPRAQTNLRGQQGAQRLRNVLDGAEKAIHNSLRSFLGALDRGINGNDVRNAIGDSAQQGHERIQILTAGHIEVHHHGNTIDGHKVAG